MQTAIPEGSPLNETDPQWKHDAYARLQADQDVAPEDREAIANLPANQWDKARRWSKEAKILGRYRDPSVPIKDIFETLSTQSRERAVELEVEAVARTVKDAEAMDAFAAQQPELFADLMATLVNHHSEFVSKALEKKGLKVTPQKPLSADSIFEELQDNPLWETIQDTDLAEVLKAKVGELSAKVNAGEITKEQMVAELNGQQTAPEQGVQTSQQFQQVQQALYEARDKQWIRAISDGVRSQGVNPATPAEMQANPQLAHLKNVIFTAAVHGLPGVIPNWDDHSAAWGEKRDGFSQTFQEVSSHLQSGDIDRFRENASSMNPFYYEFGEKRAQMGMIKSLYNTVNRLLTGAGPLPPAPQDPALPVPPAGGGVPPAPLGGNGPRVADGSGKQFRTFSERRFAEKNGLV